ncbi:MAG: prepilin-type N-terminal cleavage/methylation domain-containing protein [Planctomycetota bacterium]|nr:prepilin-type N-terminal cleavage/methylation domain-containing protein [Planctomycetota bacterium]
MSDFRHLVRHLRRSRGFSLIELLVVITIIALLLGILLPTLPKVRDSARRAVCGSNLRSMGQGIELYKNQWKEVFPKARYMPPPWLSGDTDPPLNVVMKDQIDPTTPAYRCPGDKTVWNQTYKDEQGTNQTCNMSYTYIVSIGGRKYEDTFFYKRLKVQSKDAAVAHDFDGGTFETQDGTLVPVNFFHSVRNILFADGHVGKYELND